MPKRSDDLRLVTFRRICQPPTTTFPQARTAERTQHLVSSGAATSQNMGQSVSWLSGLIWAKKEIRILILGLVCCRQSTPATSRRLVLSSDQPPQGQMLTSTTSIGQRRQDDTVVQTQGALSPTPSLRILQTRAHPLSSL